MVEQNTVACKQAITLSIVGGHPVCVRFRSSIGTTRLKCGVFALGRRRASKHLAAGCIVETSRNSSFPYCFKQSNCAKGRHITRVLRNIKADPNVTLSA